MKKLLLPVLAIIVLMFSSCKKGYQSNPSLPPITQSGADTFGCLIDGVILVPQVDYAPSLCFSCAANHPLEAYFYVYNSTSKNDQSTLSIYATDENPNGPWRSLNLFVKNMTVTEGQTITLKADTAQKGGSGKYEGDILGNYNLVDYKTTQIVSGELFISKLDQVRKFISGTFKFNAINGNKDTVHVTDGRFDVHYGQ